MTDFNNQQEINKTDEDGSTSLHVLMRNFNIDADTSSKIAVNLIKRGSNLEGKNINKLTPLHMALYYGQNEAIKFCLNHNY